MTDCLETIRKNVEKLKSIDSSVKNSHIELIKTVPIYEKKIDICIYQATENNTYNDIAAYHKEICPLDEVLNVRIVSNEHNIYALVRKV